MSGADTPTNKLTNLRRSQRVCLSVPILVHQLEANKPSTPEETHTLVVSAHGALFVLQMGVKAGDLLKIKHRKTDEELVCRVVHVGADQSGKREIGVEFERPTPRFWRIAFPPADWNPRGPDAKPPTPQPPGGRPLPKKPAPATPEAAKNQVNKSSPPAHD